MKADINQKPPLAEHAKPPRRSKPEGRLLWFNPKIKVPSAAFAP